MTLLIPFWYLNKRMRISPLHAHFNAHPVDWDLWKKLFKKHQKAIPALAFAYGPVFCPGP